MSTFGGEIWIPPVPAPPDVGAIKGVSSIPEQVAPFLRVLGARKSEEVDVRPRPSDDAAPSVRKNGPSGWAWQALGRCRAAWPDGQSGAAPRGAGRGSARLNAAYSGMDDAP